MYDFIASSFFQKKTCHLPGIGKLSFVTTAAETDFGNAQIRAPRQSIVFTPTESNEHVFNEFSAISEMMQQTLNEEELLEITGIGTFIKDKAGIIHFIPIELDSVFIQPVNDIRVLRQDAEHPILVGDTTTTNTAMSEKYSEAAENTVVEKSNWWIMAIVLTLLGLSLIAFYIYNFGIGNLGNCSSL
jgi:hypothetical protein